MASLFGAPFELRAPRRTVINTKGATITEVRGRIVAYTGDDQDGEYLYKFEGSKPWRSLRARGKSPLDHGTLYAAKFSDDGSGEWLPFVHGPAPAPSFQGYPSTTPGQHTATR